MSVVPSTFEPTDQTDFQNRLESSRIPVVLYFFEPDSNLCRLLDPSIKKVTARMTETFTFLAVDITEHKDLSYELQVMRCPAFIIFRDTKEIRRMSEVNYTEDFDTRLHDFLLGNFHFNHNQFQILDSMNLSSRLGAGFQVDIVTFMRPGEPMNWNLMPVLRTLQDKHKNTTLFSLVNAYQSPDVLKHFKVKQTPSVMAFNNGSTIKSWEPVDDIESFMNECDRLIQ